VKKRVFVAAEVDPVLIERLQRDSRVDLTYRPVKTEQELAALVSDAEILVTRYHNRVSAGVLNRAKTLRLIVQGTSGTDNIDSDAAAGKNVPVISIPGENANAVAEWVIGTSIALTRTLPWYDVSMRRGQWLRDDCATRRELHAHQMGIIGIGRVGTRVAKLAAAFGIRPIAYDPYLTADQVGRRGATRIDSLEELLRKTDILTLHVPLTAETRRMIAAPQLDLLPEGAVVLNACRGPVVDTDALLDRLERGHLGGVALDVFEEEPPRTPRWPDNPRLLLSPHIGGCSRESKESIALLIYEKISEYLDEVVGIRH
jgi:phosphoglycerate dehydrogenase-like enzyme